MAKSYSNTADNMYKASKILKDNEQWHISCYLAGYVVECTFNSIILTHFKETGKAREFQKEHLNERNEQKAGNDPAVILDTLLKNEKSLAKFSFLLKGSQTYPTSIVEGKAMAGKSKKMEPWASSLRYDQRVWNKEWMAEEAQLNLEAFFPKILEMLLKGEMKRDE